MTRSELAYAVATRFKTLVAKDVEISIKVILDAIGHSMAEGNRVEIRGFGTFHLTYRPARLGRNPKSGASVMIPEKYVPYFKAGKEMRERIDQPVRNEKIRIVTKDNFLSNQKCLRNIDN